MAGILALAFLGFLAGQNSFTHICQWATHHWQCLKNPLGFKSQKLPNQTTLSRLLAKISLNELQEAFAVFLSPLLQEQPLTAAVDGKVSQPILDEYGEVLQLLNVFVHKMKVVLNEWSVKGDKTNELGCLKQHLGELFAQFPHLKILTGDAIFAQRPLLRVLKDKVDYVFQITDKPTDFDAKVNKDAVLKLDERTIDAATSGEYSGIRFSDICDHAAESFYNGKTPRWNVQNSLQIRFQTRLKWEIAWEWKKVVAVRLEITRG
jgi:hypothetical protein